MWNYRVFRKIDVDGTEFFEIHEVYYNDEHRVEGWTEDPMRPMGLSIEDLREDLLAMLGALDEDALDEKGLERFLGDGSLADYED